VSRSGLAAVISSKSAALTHWRRSPMALSGPQHYVAADRLLAEIEAVPTMPDATETALSVRAAAHAILAAAAALPWPTPARTAKHGTRLPGRGWASNRRRSAGLPACCGLAGPHQGQVRDHHADNPDDEYPDVDPAQGVSDTPRPLPLRRGSRASPGEVIGAFITSAVVPRAASSASWSSLTGQCPGPHPAPRGAR
jgi:hypothetical protein